MKWFLFVVLVVLVKVSNSAGIGYRENDADGVCKMKNVAKKVGCYKDGKGDVGGTRPLTKELVNIRDPTNPAYVKDLALNWSDWKGSLNGLLCECAKRAQAKGYRYIGLQFYGECWSGPNSKNYAKDKEASTCIQEYFTECDVDDTEHPCTGAAWTNYVYSVKGVGKSESKSKSGSGNKSESKSKSGSGSNSESKSKSGSGSNSESKSKSGSGSESGNKSKSGSGNKSGNKSKSGSGNKSGNKSKSGSGNKSGEKSKSGSGNKSGKKSKSGSGNKSGNKSKSGSGNKSGKKSTKTTKRGRRETKRAEAKQKRQRFRK